MHLDPLTMNLAVTPKIGSFTAAQTVRNGRASIDKPTRNLAAASNGKSIKSKLKKLISTTNSKSMKTMVLT